MYVARRRRLRAWCHREDSNLRQRRSQRRVPSVERGQVYAAAWRPVYGVAGEAPPRAVAGSRRRWRPHRRGQARRPL